MPYKDPKKQKEYMDEYVKTYRNEKREELRCYHRKYQQKYRKTHPYPLDKQNWAQRNVDKQRAHKMIARAKKSGKIKPLNCEMCGNPNSGAHHHDYSKPLEIRWLCHLHHYQVHKQT